MHRPYTDCPAHGHLVRSTDHVTATTTRVDHVVQTPDICSEHAPIPRNNEVGRTEPITLYAAKNANKLSSMGKDAYEHLHGGSRDVLHGGGHVDQRPRPLVE